VPTDVKLNVQLPDIEQVPVECIDATGRARQEYTGLAELAHSIETYGLNHPLVVGPKRPDGTYKLLSGGRRFRAIGVMGATHVPCRVRSDWTEMTGLEWELEENIQREALDWPSQVEHQRQLHDLLDRRARSAGNANWTLGDTAGRLPAPGMPVASGAKMSEAKLRQGVRMAGLMKQRPDILVAVKRLPLSAAIKRTEHILAAEAASKETINVQGTLRHGNARDLLVEVESGSVACVVTDPPFGIDTISENRLSGNNIQGAIISDTDNLDSKEAVRAMQWFVPELFRVLLPGGHFYIFWCQQNWASLRGLVLAAGLELQEYPVVWVKRGTTAPGRGYLYQPMSEPVMFGWKPPRTRLLERSMGSVVECASIRGGIHPYQKPVELLKTFILQSTIPGEIVLDPFAGSGSTVVAAIATRRRGLGFDLDPSNTTFPLAAKRVERALRNKGELDPAGSLERIACGPASPPVPASFHDTRPGDPGWIAFWAAHPDQQDAMLAWALELKRGAKGASSLPEGAAV
jgi:site-specific DNA-methyltransferase (adenine-specific)